LGAVASDVFGASGRAILRALMKGESDAEALAELSKGRLRNKIPELRRALEGQVTGHHRFLIDRHWRQMESLENQMRQFAEEIAERMKPTAEEIARMRESLPAEARRSSYGMQLRFPRRSNGQRPSASVSLIRGRDGEVARTARP